MKKIIKRLIIWAVVIAVILLLPFLSMLFDIKFYDPGSGFEEMNWDLSDFVIIGVALFSVGLAYEFIARRSQKTVYRVAFALGLFGALLLFWINGAVGIIGSEDNPANLMYGAVFMVGLIGSLLSRFRPRGMSYTLFAAAMAQLLVPVFALLVWPAKATWGEPGVIGVFIINFVFVALFVISALLFQLASKDESR